MNDPRRNAPSCSSLERIANCPISFRWSQGVPEERSADSESGDRVHHAIKTDCDDGLSLVELETTEKCREQRDKILAEWPETQRARFAEHRLGLTTDGDMVDLITDRCSRPLLISGQSDDVYVAHTNRAAIILDYKSLWGHHAAAPDNDQLRGYAVLTALRWNLRHVTVALIQPNKGQPTLAQFDEAALAQAEQWLRPVATIALNPQQHFMPGGKSAEIPVPGDWCKFCPAAKRCPALLGKTADLSWPVGVATNIYQEKAESELRGYLKEHSGPELASLLETAKLAEWYIKAIRDDARRRLRAGEKVGDWSLETTRGNREINDANAAWPLIAPLLANHPDGALPAYAAALTVSVARVVDAVRKASGPKITASGQPHKTQFAMTAPAASKAVEDALGEQMTRGEDRVSLVRVKRIEGEAA